MSATDRHLAARIAAATRWSQTTSEERLAATRPARTGFLKRFERMADPEGRMTEADRVRAGEQLMKAHMLRLALARRKKRKERAAPRQSVS